MKVFVIFFLIEHEDKQRFVGSHVMARNWASFSEGYWRQCRVNNFFVLLSKTAKVLILIQIFPCCEILTFKKQ